jgi:hypothetical protein
MPVPFVARAATPSLGPDKMAASLRCGHSAATETAEQPRIEANL